MTYDNWKTTNPADDFLGPDPGQCERCDEPWVGSNENGVFLCEDCMFEEAIEQVMPDIVAGKYGSAETEKN